MKAPEVVLLFSESSPIGGGRRPDSSDLNPHCTIADRQYIIQRESTLPVNPSAFFSLATPSPR
jgi:hypothetical protein